MRKHKLKVDDPDNFWSHVDYVDDEGNCHITIKEGDMPIQPPRYYYVVEDD